MFWALPSEVPPARLTIPNGKVEEVEDDALQTCGDAPPRTHTKHQG